MNSDLFVMELWFTFVNLSTDVWFMNVEIGERLKEERGRLEMNQTQFAAVAGVGKTTQINYESGNRVPDAEYLASLAKVGLDVQYVVTGVRSSVALSPDERDLVAMYRSAALAGKMAAVGALQGAADAARHGANGPSAGRDMINSGNVVEGSMQVFHKAPKGDVVGRDLIKKKR
ncbi:helix-turn-helix domain-containing protein [Burkholderia gladioli]|uniref:helix-turn-helix domain-containing protein n=1 Tax=Burkholderia gladioli TaxID=28095 RepID=UPI001FC83706|nr:helix-turn-helix transcriptional regulator [Burkholderia gladioli]